MTRSRERDAKAGRQRRFKVGDRVRFRFGGRAVVGVIVEDRGPLGAGGRFLYSVRIRLDRFSESTFEVPADELRAA